MNKLKFVSLLAGATLVATSLLGGVAAAATGSMSLSGTPAQSSGDFAVSIFENSDDTVNYAEAHLGFSGTVQNVSIDFGGSAFTPQPCGTNCAGGYIAGGATVTGSNKLATVHFTLVNPGSVTVSIGSGSYLAHPVPGSVSQSIATAGGSATFTYTAPAPSDPTPTPSNPGTPTTGGSASNNGGSKPAATSHSSNTTATTGDVQGDSTQAAPATASTDKKSDTKATTATKKGDLANATASHKSGSDWLWFVLGLAAIVTGYAFIRKYLHNKGIAKKPVAPVKKVVPTVKKTAATKATTKKATITRRPATNGKKR